MTNKLISRDPENVQVESTHPAFAPVGTTRMVTAQQATALAILRRGRIVTEDLNAAAPAAETSEIAGGSGARSARPARGNYNRSDMQAKGNGRGRDDS